MTTPPADPTLDQALAWQGSIPAREATTAHPDCRCTRCRHRQGNRCGKGAICHLARDRCPMHGKPTR